MIHIRSYLFILLCSMSCILNAMEPGRSHSWLEEVLYEESTYEQKYIEASNGTEQKKEPLKKSSSFREKNPCTYIQHLIPSKKYTKK
jgi:hypothetical protein